MHTSSTKYRGIFFPFLILFIVITVLFKPGSSASEKNMNPTARNPLPNPDEIAGLPPDGGENFNRLVFSQSPYLLQHARNPVDWYPWGKTAFEKARTEDKPIFLSVGYSTCHWCHVMEHESFEDDAVAALLNQHFVSIKVDREERPDVDKIYMDVTQAMTGNGGWPMTVILTPDRKPFFSGTYFPKNGRYGRPGMMDLIPQLANVWKTDRDRVIRGADEITEHLKAMNVSQPGEKLNSSTLDKAYDQLAARFDGTRGGFGSQPKFPTPHNFTFLLRYHQRTGNEKARQMVEQTLREMRLGGIYDHVGFGFHRYSTDRDWLLPHFEKMLYDQALIALAYLEAWQVTHVPLFEQTAREIFTYVLRDMTAPEGGFYSAEDADSEGEEGKFYVWTVGEVNEILGEEDGELFTRVFRLKEKGNFHHEAGGQDHNDNIPHLKKPLDEWAAELNLKPDDFRRHIQTLREKLFAVREERIHPLKDDKILTDWNGLMIASLARGGRILGDDSYTAAATKAADFLLTHLKDSQGRLLKRSRQGQAGLPAHIEDYAFAVWGLLNVYEDTYEPKYLTEAMDLTDTLLKHFWDDEKGGLFLTADDGETLLVRGKEIYDGAIPSGNSVAALNLVRLARMTGNRDYEEKAQALLRSFSGTVEASPSGHTQFMSALDFSVGPAYEVVICGNSTPESRNLLTPLERDFRPSMVTLFQTPETRSQLSAAAPFTAEMKMRDGQPTAYVCKNFSCNQPTTDLDKMLASLTSVEK